MNCFEFAGSYFFPPKCQLKHPCDTVFSMVLVYVPIEVYYCREDNLESTKSSKTLTFTFVEKLPDKQLQLNRI